MYLKQLELSNFKTIKEFKKDFVGNIYLVTGENEFGKSTLLQAIAILLTGARDEVLKTGEEKGFVKGIIGDDGKNYEVELRFTKANPRGTLSITDKESGLKSDKVSTIQDIFGYQDFNASEFISWSDSSEGRRKQLNVVKSLLPEQVQKQVADLDIEITKTFESRKDANSEIKVHSTLVKAKLKNISETDIEKYAKPIEMKELITKKTEAATLTEQFKGVERRYEERKNRKVTIPIEIKDLKSILKVDIDEIKAEELRLKKEFENKISQLLLKIDNVNAQAKVSENDLNDELAEINEKQKTADTWIKENKPEDLEIIQTEIDDAETHNIKHTNVKEYLSAKSNLDKSTKSKEILEKTLELKRSEREKAIKESKLPIDGLSFSEDCLILNGIPFEHDKVSASQEMEVAIKLIIAKNKKVKIFKIDRAESLGSVKFNALIDFAKKEGFQGFFEEMIRNQNELVVCEYTEK